MKAYHIRTMEPDSGSPFVILGATFDLDAIYIPEKRVVLGIGYYKEHLGDRKGRNRVFVMDYSDKKYIERADCILNGNANGVNGAIVGEINLSDTQASAISDNRKYANKTVKTTAQFDMSTERTLGILSGEEIKQPWTFKKFFA